MIVTLFQTVYAETGTRLSASFNEVADRICTPHYVVADKLHAWAYSPFEFAGDRRGKGAWARCHFGVVDCDDLTDQQLAAVLATRERLGLAAALYSTYSHGKARQSQQLQCAQCQRLYAGIPELQPLCKNVRCRSSRYTLTGYSGFWRLRLLVPFSRPVNVDEWPRFHASWRVQWGQVGDASDHAKGHLYTVPSVPPGDTTPPVLLRWQGGEYNVDTALANAPAGTVATPKPHMASITLDTLLATCAKLKRRPESWIIDGAVRAEKALRLEPFAEPGERDNQLWQIAKVIAYPLSNVAPAAIAEHFRAAIEGLGPGATTFPQFVDKLERAQAEALQAQASKTPAHDEDSLHRARIHSAFRQNRDEGYTDQEFAAFAQLEQCDAAAFQHRWIIQYGSSFYYYSEGRYSQPYPFMSARNAALRDLAPAHKHVELFEVDRFGLKARKTHDKLIEEYGSVARACEVDMTAQRAYYDASRFTMVEASSPLDRTLTPEYSPQVAKWLKLLGGAKHDFLSQWIAHVTDLSRPFVALVFTGAAGAGKSLLAHGLARLFGASEPTPMRQAFGTYNHALMTCPLVFADEQLPRDARGRVQTTELREFIQSRVRPLTRKYLPDALLIGAVRVIIAANNPAILAFPEILDANDIRAITERLFHIAVSQEASDYLTFIGVEECERWVREGVIARHALYLRENLASTKLAARFGLTDPDSTLAKTLATRTGDRALVLRFCAQYCLQPQAAESSGRLVRTLDGRLLVSIQGIERLWTVYMLNERMPTTNKLALALQGISHDLALVVMGDDNRPQTYRNVDIDMLTAWVRDTDFATPETIAAVLQENTEVRAARNRNVVPMIRAIR